MIARREVKSLDERTWERWVARNPHVGNDGARALDLINLTVCDNSGGMQLSDMPDDWILPLIHRAREIRQEPRGLEAEVRARGALRLVQEGAR